LNNAKRILKKAEGQSVIMKSAIGPFANRNRQFAIGNSYVRRIGISAMMLSCALAIGCHDDAAAPTGSVESGTTSPAKISVINVTEAELGDRIEVPCSIEGYEQAMLMPRIEGYVSQVLVDIGEAVKKGQVLAELDVPELQAEVERRQSMIARAESDVVSRQAEVRQAEARLAESQSLLALRESKLKRAKNLVEGGALKQEQLDEAQYAFDAVKAAITRGEADVRTAQAMVKSALSAVSVAEAEMNKSEAMVGYTKIRAPFDGLVTQRMVDPGALVRPAGGDAATALFEVARVDKVRAVMFLPIDQVRQLDDGDGVELHGLAGQVGRRISGDISRHAGAFHQGSRMMRAEIDLENPVDDETGRRAFAPGDYGRVSLTLRKVKGSAVPLSALVKDNGSQAVMIVDAQNQCRKTNVNVIFEGAKVALLDDPALVGQRLVTAGQSVEDQQPLSAYQIELVDYTIE
jgi:RND family efflux transporter MFP subunit